MLSCHGWNWPLWNVALWVPRTLDQARTTHQVQGTKHARDVDMVESALVLIEERHHSRLERVLGADDTQAVALNQGFEQL